MTLRMCAQCFDVELVEGGEFGSYCSDLCSTRAALIHAQCEMARKIRQVPEEIEARRQVASATLPEFDVTPLALEVAPVAQGEA